MLELADSWVWDSWYADDGVDFHCFFLKASRGLGDPDRRHHWPVVGHAVSRDLTHWRVVADAFAPHEPPAFDDQGIWTGSVVREDDGPWHLFYTGIDREYMSTVQRIGHAVSHDLYTWHRVSSEPVVIADNRWYSCRMDGFTEDWRDPWVVREADGWRMLITAKDMLGVPGRSGCIASATSTDLQTWEVEGPVASEVGLGQLEVVSTVEVGGSFVLAFCLSAADVNAPGLPKVTGTWTAPAESLVGPFHLDRAEPIDVPGNYAGRIVRDRSGQWNLMAFVDRGAQGEFVGRIGNPVPLVLTERGTLQPLAAEAVERFGKEAT